MNFGGRRVLVTGSTRGIGLATARRLRDLGARVAVNGRTPQAVEAAIAQLGRDGLAAAPGDIASAAGCRAVVATAIERLGGLDVLVNNAGLFRSGPAESFDEAEFDRMMAVNVKAVYFCIVAALPALRASRGNIVNVASVSGLMGNRLCGAYCGSKGAVVNMTRALMLELAPDVRINCVCPGGVDTDMLRDDATQSGDPEGYMANERSYPPLKRIATAEEVAGVIAFLASDEAAYVTGAAWPIDAGVSAGH
jgi:NAD(P)-dependent dehydrogenase (short-subunit alcohol dehydrogenase family)